MNTLVVGVLQVLFLIAFFGVAQGQELIVKNTIGLAEDNLILFRPIDLTWADDGRAYVLNEGNGSIAVFSPDWQHIATFGNQGPGPGEISNPSMLMIFEEEIWVKEMTGAEVFDLDGRPLRTQSLSHQIASIKPHGKVMVGWGTYADGCGLRLDRNGDVASFFGPKSSAISGMAVMSRSIAWVVLPQAGDRCILLNRFDGLAWQVEADNSAGPSIDLKLGKGTVGNNFRSKMVLSDVCSDPAGGYYVIHYPEAGGAGFLIRFSPTWEKNGTWEFPGDMRPGTVRVGPSGELCLLAEKSSTLYICERPVN